MAPSCWRITYSFITPHCLPLQSSAINACARAIAYKTKTCQAVVHTTTIVNLMYFMSWYFLKRCFIKWDFQKTIGFVVLIATSAMVNTANADSQFWQKGEFSRFCQALETPEPQTLSQILGEFNPLAKRDINGKTDKIRIVTFDKVKPKLDQAVQDKMSILQLFTLKEYAEDDHCLLLYNQDTLKRISDNYKLHGVWMTNAPIKDSHDKYLPMKFLLIGHGKLIIGYPDNEEVEVKDYKVGSENYNYTKYTSMDIVHDGSDIALKNIKTRKRPNSNPGEFIGPLNTAINSISLESRRVRINKNTHLFKFLAVNIDTKPIEKIK